MTKLELIIVIGFVAVMGFVLLTLLFPATKKKAKDKKAKDSKAGEKDKKTSETKSGDGGNDKKADEQSKEEPAKEEKKLTPFKVIKRKSEVKINKKAINANSRNPSVARVFKDGKKIDDIKEEQAKEEKVEVGANNKTAGSSMSDITRGSNPGRFGFREPSERSPFGFPNRSPIIGDRTDFKNRLNVDDNNNLYGVSVAGVNKQLEIVSSKSDDAEQKAIDMFESVRRNILARDGGFMPYGYSDFDHDAKPNAKSRAQKLKELDAETLVIADAVLKRKVDNK